MDKLKGWMVPLLLLGTLTYALAEEITLTTYYPSPRGVYNELRTAGNVQIGSIEPPASADLAPRLHVVRRNADTDPADTGRPALLVEDEIPNATTPDPTPFIIDEQGNVGIGSPSPGQKLTVAGVIESTVGGLKFPDGTTQSAAGLGQPTAADVTASRAAGPSYQNLSGKARFLAVEVTGPSSVLYIGPTSPPNIAVADAGGARVMMPAWVPDQWYYRLDTAGSALERWVEYDL